MIAPVITSSHARQHLSSTIRKCVDDSQPVVITSRHRKVVMVPLEDWESIQETEYLLRDPDMAAHLRESIAEIEAGNTTSMTLEETRAFLGL